MTLLAATTPELMLPRLVAATREEAIRSIAEHLARQEGIGDGAALVDEVLARERERETDVGRGIAIPHARSRVVSRTRLAVATLATPLAPVAADRPPVDLLLLIVGPRRDPRPLLQILARLARLLRREEFPADLRAATTRAELWEAFRRHAADV